MSTHKSSKKKSMEVLGYCVFFTAVRFFKASAEIISVLF